MGLRSMKIIHHITALSNFFQQIIANLKSSVLFYICLHDRSSLSTVGPDHYLHLGVIHFMAVRLFVSRITPIPVVQFTQKT